MKGQLWSLDFIISATLFFLMIVVLIFVWNYIHIQNTEQKEITDLESTALSVSDSMIRVGGMPEDWDSGNVQSIGLASRCKKIFLVNESESLCKNVLNTTKIERFLNLNYNTTKSLLGIGSYEFYSEIKYLNDSIVNINGNDAIKGLYPASSRIVVPVRRYGLLEGEIVKLNLIIWDS